MRTEGAIVSSRLRMYEKGHACHPFVTCIWLGTHGDFTGQAEHSDLNTLLRSSQLM